MLLRALYEDPGPDADFRIRERLKFHCPDPQKRSYALAAERCKAYEERAARVLGPIAVEFGIPQRGFWTKNEMRSALSRQMHTDSVPEREHVMRAYDQLLRDLNEGDAYDVETVMDVRRYIDPMTFVRRLVPDPESHTDPAFQACYARLVRGGRERVDIEYVKASI